MSDDRELYRLHTLDTEAYEAALEAATRSLRESDLVNREHLEALAAEEGVVAEAAARLLGGAA